MTISSKNKLKAIRALCDNERARCEAVILASGGSRKLHEPMVDMHRGSLMVLQKILAVLDDVSPLPYNRGELLEWYVNARTEGWVCEAPHSNGDRWEQALLTKNGHVAEIDIPGGKLVVYRPDNTQINDPTPYKKQDYTSKRTRSRGRS